MSTIILEKTPKILKIFFCSFSLTLTVVTHKKRVFFYLFFSPLFLEKLIFYVLKMKWRTRNEKRIGKKYIYLFKMALIVMLYEYLKWFYMNSKSRLLQHSEQWEIWRNSEFQLFWISIVNSPFFCYSVFTVNKWNGILETIRKRYSDKKISLKWVRNLCVICEWISKTAVEREEKLK